MRNFTLKACLLGAALGSFAGASAQGILQFETDETNFFQSEGAWLCHRTSPLFADFNGDGIMDAYYGGTSCSNGWATRGVLMEGLGNGQYRWVTDVKYETVIVQEQATDEQGNLLWENPDAPEGEEKIPLMVDKEVERFAGMQNGLPLSAFGLGSFPFDFNQDGLVDFILMNRGGNDTGTVGGLVLVKNLGNFQFEVVEDEALATTSDGGTGWENWNATMYWGSLAVGDYDKDGYPDILVQNDKCKEGGRMTRLFHNVKGERFEVANVFDPLPLDKEINMTSLYVKTPDEIDIETGDPIPGDFTETPTYQPVQMSHGQVMMGDFNGDGWLDIVTVGYSDYGTSVKYGPQEGGYSIRFYQNTKNGRFQDVTDKMVAEAGRIIPTLEVEEGRDYEVYGTISDVYKVWGSEDALWYAMDWNQDGLLDIVMSGDLQNRTGKKITIALVSTPDENGDMCFKEESTGLIPVSAACTRAPMIVDFNADDVADFILYGWTSYEDRNNWCDAYMSSNGEPESYTLMDQWYGPDEYNSGSYHVDLGTQFGDVDGDGLLDMLSFNYVGSAEIPLPDGTVKVVNEKIVPSYNRSADPSDIVVPEAPGNLEAKAGEEEGTVVVTWDLSYLKTGYSAMYNLYIEDAEGNTRMLVPAIKSSGKQMGYPQFSSYVLGKMEDESATYTFEQLPEGQYTVGVQAVNYGYHASEFATATVTVTDGYTSVKAVKPAVETKVVVNGNTITVNSNEDAAVEIYAATGAQVAAGRTNEAMTVNGKGVFVVKANGTSVKVVK